MTLTHYDVVEGRVGASLLLGFLAFAVIANFVVGTQTAARGPALLALGGAVAIFLQNAMLAVSNYANGPEEIEEPDEPDAA